MAWRILHVSLSWKMAEYDGFVRTIGSAKRQKLKAFAGDGLARSFRHAVVAARGGRRLFGDGFRNDFQKVGGALLES